MRDWSMSELREIFLEKSRRAIVDLLEFRSRRIVGCEAAVPLGRERLEGLDHGPPKKRADGHHIGVVVGGYCEGRRCDVKTNVEALKTS